jgi:hypothetical protein
MPFDLSAIDAQLAALGPIPRNLRDLIEGAALRFSSLADTDAQLDALAAGNLSAPSPRAPRNEPKSGEISLPDPVYRADQPASGELDLDEVTPRSGSYALGADPTDLPDDEDFAAPSSTAEVLQITLPTATRIEFAASSATSSSELSPLSLFPEGDDEPPTSRDALEATPPPRRSSEDISLKKPQGPLAARDPDAEFDSLFEEATSPSGIPTRPLDDDGSIEDLLSGLASNKPGRPPAVSESESAIDALFELEDGDSTEVVEAKTVFGDGGLPNLDPFPAEEELGSSEFEIVLDEAGAAKDIIRSDRPGALKNSPPPPAGEDKRPSFLGRLFGKKDD